MALTLLEEPNSWQPVYNPIIYRYSSDQTAQTNFEIKIVIEFSKIDPDTGAFTSYATIAELSQPPAPDGTVTFDIHKYLSNELTSVHNLDNPNKIVEGLKSGQQMLRYRVTPYETYTTDLEWQFNRIVKYTDGGVTRPSFEITAPLTTSHLYNSYAGYPFQISLVAGDPAGETFNGKIFTVTDSTDTDLLYSTSGVWEVSTETTYTVDGTAVLTSAVTNEDIGTVSAVASTWNSAFSFTDFIPWLKPTGEGLIGSPNYEFDQVVPRDDYFYRAGTALMNDISFLTTMPVSGFEIMPHDYVWVQCQTARDNSAKYLEVTTDNGVFLYSNIIDLIESVSDQTTLTMGVGAANLLGTTPDSIRSGSLPVIDNSTSFISFRLSEGGAAGGSKTYTMNIKTPCTIYPVGSILYLDTFGSYLPINFYMKKKSNVNISRLNYQKNYGAVGVDFNGNNRWSYDSFSAGKTNIDTTYTEVFTVTTDWLTDAESVLMQNLLLSPDTFFIDENSEAVSINILTSSFKRKSVINNQLFNYTLSFEYSNKSRLNG